MEDKKKKGRQARERNNSFGGFGLREDNVPWGSFTGEKKLNNIVILFSRSSPAAVMGLNHIILVWLRG